jgi:hypothetical protein
MLRTNSLELSGDGGLAGLRHGERCLGGEVSATMFDAASLAVCCCQQSMCLCLWALIALAVYAMSTRRVFGSLKGLAFVTSIHFNDPDLW